MQWLRKTQPNWLPTTLALAVLGFSSFSCIQWQHKATRQTLDSSRESDRDRDRVREWSRERGRERGSSNAAAWRLFPFVHFAALVWLATAFHITTIFYAQLSGFLCICAASVAAAAAIAIAATASAYMKNYTKSQELREESAKCLPCTWLCYFSVLGWCINQAGDQPCASAWDNY